MPPSDIVLARAANAGVRCWGGYLDGGNIQHGWTDSDFARVKAHGMVAIGYFSGYADPYAIRARAQRLGIHACLDVEGGIRGDGSWVQGVLDRSGAGLYGNGSVHRGRHAAFHVLAWFPYLPPKASTWGTSRIFQRAPRPPGPCAWQYRGTHSEFGISVDSAYFDDWFLEGVDVTPNEVQNLIDGFWAGVENGATARLAGSPQPDHAKYPAASRGWKLADTILAGGGGGGLTIAQVKAAIAASKITP